MMTYTLHIWNIASGCRRARRNPSTIICSTSQGIIFPPRT